MKELKRIAVFCGSNSGNDQAYKLAAQDLGKALCKANISLVYGGANVGLMGAIANAVLTNDGEAIGVIPRELLGVEIVHKHLSELFVVHSMQERKAMIASMADAYILMPGGSGSLDEFFEIFTWLQLGFHKKPCGILNIKGYFDDMLKFLDNAVKEGFMRPEHTAAILVADDPKHLLTNLQNHEPVLPEKWIRA